MQSKWNDNPLFISYRKESIFQIPSIPVPSYFSPSLRKKVHRQENYFQQKSHLFPLKLAPSSVQNRDDQPLQYMHRDGKWPKSRYVLMRGRQTIFKWSSQFGIWLSGQQVEELRSSWWPYQAVRGGLGACICGCLMWCRYVYSIREKSKNVCSSLRYFFNMHMYVCMSFNKVRNAYLTPKRTKLYAILFIEAFACIYLCMHTHTRT